MRRLACVLLVWLLLSPSPAQSGREDEGGPVYLVYAGPYSTSPSSAYGHIFLVLAGAADEPLPLWDVVSFSADTGDAGALLFMAAGIAGGFHGSYRVGDFHEKSRDYQVLEDRDLWLTRIRLSAPERERLARELARQRGRWYRYAFFNRNCAYYLQRLLSTALDDLPPPQGIVSPIGVFDLLETLGRVEASYHRPALSTRLHAMVQDVSAPALRRVRETPWAELASETDWLLAQSGPTRAFLQEFFRWKTMHQDAPLTPATRDGLAALRLHNARPESGASLPPVGTPGAAAAFPRFHSYAKLTMASRHRRNATDRVEVRYRPSLHEATDPWVGYRPVNTMEILSLAVSTPIDAAGARLEELVLFSQQSLSPAAWGSRPWSWMLELAARRGGPLGPERLHSGLGLGFGRSTRLFPSIHLHALATSEVLMGGGARTVLAPGLRAGGLALISSRWRLGAETAWSAAALGPGGDFVRGEVWLHRDLGPAGVTLRGRRVESTSSLRVELSIHL